MKKFCVIVFLFAVFTAKTQTPSDCSIPAELSTYYERDIKNMALRRMDQLQSPDLQLIRIPSSWQDTIARGLAAILQSGLPEADSVFNRYCVHDNTSPMQIYQGLLIQVDLAYPWTQAWQNLNTITGNPYIDTLTTRYHLQLVQFFDWSFADYALLHTDSLWNVYALIDSLTLEPGVLNGEPDYIIGTAGRIEYDKIDDIQYINFWFQFNDCFDGCDNYRKWKFRVNEDCEVNYLGFEDFGVFGIEPLPTPSDCAIYTFLPVVKAHRKFSVYPNPASHWLSVKTNISIGYPQDYEIHDFAGKIVQSGSLINEDQKISVSALSPGVYSFHFSVNKLAVSFVVME